MSTPLVSNLETVDGRPFVAYAAGDGTVLLERITKSGRRSRKSMFQFDAFVLIQALMATQAGEVAKVLETLTHSIH